MKRLSQLAALAGALTACTPNPRYHDDDSLQAILGAYHERMAPIEAAQGRPAVRRLEIEIDGETGQVLVSADLAHAPTSEVVEDILERANLAYDFVGVRVTGKSTTKFNKLPLVEALNRVIAGQGLSAVEQNGVILLRSGRLIDGYGQEAQARTATGKVVLNHIDTETALTVLRGLYWGGNDTGDDAEVNFGAVPDHNAIFLTGPGDVLQQAMAVLSATDREVPQILIETLVVDFDLNAVANFGMNVSDAAYDHFSNIGVTPGNISLSFLKGAVNPTQLTAMIDMLVQENAAQILARPYIATRSTQEALIEIVGDQYVAVQQSVDGATLASTDSISAGVILKATPAVMGGERIRMDISVEESNFLPTGSGGETLVQVDRNTTSTSLDVSSGQTIVIGGLNLRRLLESSGGLPWLRDVPILNMLTANRIGLEQERELVIYMTPRIWVPSMRTGLDAEDALGVTPDDLTIFERGQQ